jgi:lambda repressor-like predicted transcriptional regulator
MSKRGWAILAGALTAAIVLVAALWIGVSQISAQGPETTPVSQGPGACNCDCSGGLTPRQAGRWGYQAYGQVDIVAERLGMTVGEVVAALQDGKSVADLAAEKGVALDTIIEALMAPRREALAAAVANGRLTQEQADTMLAEMQENIAEHLQQAGLPMGQGPAGQLLRAERMGWQVHGQLDLIAETLGMTDDELLAALQDGKTVAQVAEEKGVALETVVEALLAPRREALAERVAEGNLTQEQADTMLAEIQENLTNRLQQTWQRGGMFGGGGVNGVGQMGGGRAGGGRMGGGRMGGGRGMWGATQP